MAMELQECRLHVHIEVIFRTRLAESKLVRVFMRMHESHEVVLEAAIMHEPKASNVLQ